MVDNVEDIYEPVYMTQRGIAQALSPCQHTL